MTQSKTITPTEKSRPAKAASASTETKPITQAELEAFYAIGILGWHAALDFRRRILEGASIEAGLLEFHGPAGQDSLETIEEEEANIAALRGSSFGDVDVSLREGETGNIFTKAPHSPYTIQSELEVLHSALRINRNDHGCSTPTEEFLRKLLRYYGRWNTPLTPDAVEEELSEYRENFASALRDSQIMLDSYPELFKLPENKDA